MIDKELLNKKYWFVDNIDIDAIIKLKNEYYSIIYKDKLYKGGLYDEQMIISNELIYNIIKGNKIGKWQDVLINITRQFWKSFIVYSLIWFVLIFFPKILWIQWYTIWITANKKDQLKKNYTELRGYITKCCEMFNISVDESTKNAIQLWNWAKIVLFSMEADNNEWETLHWIVDDEAQALNFDKFSSEIIPMWLRTWAICTYVWVAWYSRNSFYDKLQSPEELIFKLDYNDCVEICKKRYEETNDVRHLLYVQGIQKQLQSNELPEDTFKTQYLLEWILGVWNFIERARLEQYKWQKLDSLMTNSVCYAWLDFWKKKDKTILTIITIEEGKVKITLWREYMGDMRVQFDSIKGEIGRFNVARIYADSTANQDSTIDFLESYLGVGRIKRIPFSSPSKHAMYTNLELILQSWNFEYLDNTYTRTFENQMCDLVKEYRWNYMVCHHPDETNGHDDYPDSLALACYFKIEFPQYNSILK